MFTLDQITAAHAKIKSGADFPKYILDITQLGVTSYETYVHDGRTVYFGKDNYKISTPAKYAALTVSEQTNKERFSLDLKAHQQAKTNYPTFCSNCAKSGIAKWVVDTQKMTCTYYDNSGNEILIEVIPALAEVSKLS